MTTLVLAAAGGALGTAFAGPLGAVACRVVGAAAGAALDGALFSGGTRTRFVEGPRLTDVAGLASTEGAPIPRVYGRVRIGGEVVWATRLEEVATTSVERGASAKGGAQQTRTVRTDYAYYANVAVGLCEGPVAFVRRIWADGRELDHTLYTFRIHAGGADQVADPLIVAKEGAERAPAYRGLAYVVFERLALAEFGNRVPQFSFEVIRPVADLATQVRAVNLIPGASEFGLDTTPVTEVLGLGSTRPANRFQLQRVTDVIASLDALQALCPNLRKVAVVATWFGDDLRVGHCTVAPRVEWPHKVTLGDTWFAAGLAREAARVVTRTPDGAPAYGGTPSDAGLARLVAALTARGLAVTLYPFVMMDIPFDTTLPSPRDPAAKQPPYPWRGRITCDPAPGVSGSVDGTATAAEQVAAFFGTGAGFDYRRLVRHYATLAADWGLEAFMIGSELVGITRVRGAGGTYPAVAHLRAIASEVRAILGPGVKLVYAADWTEYGAHVREGGAEVRFPLDPLFADSAIDAVGIDYYPPITDGAYAKPWIFRAKDLVGWWSNAHVERAGGVETGATAWVPKGKPIWLTEIGVPAIDKGANGPNVFPDPKSSDGGLPPFSRGDQDELQQVAVLEAVLARFDSTLPGHEAAWNPASPVYGGPMVDPARMFVWAWDCRPFSALPDFSTIWKDAENWRVGHWITGRIEGCPVDRLIGRVLDDLGVDVPRETALAGWVDGYLIDRPMSARDALEPLADLFALDVVDRAGTLVFTGRNGRRDVVALARENLVAEGERPLLALTRSQETELPLEVQLSVTDGEGSEYRRATVASRRLAGRSRREARVEAAAVMRRAAAQALADAWLHDAWGAREEGALAVSPRLLGLEPGDWVALPGGGLHRVTRIVGEPGARKLATRGFDPAVRLRPRAIADASSQSSGVPDTVRDGPGGVQPRPPAIPGPAEIAVLDLPAARGEPPALAYVAAAAEPWPGALAVWRAPDPAGPFTLDRRVEAPALIGRTLTELPPGPVWRWDDRATLDIRLPEAASLASVSDEAALGGANLFSVQGPDGAWEIFSAARAELVAVGTWRLSRLLRGLGGDEAPAERSVPAGATIVRLDDGGPVALSTSLDEAGRALHYRIGPADRDPADPSFVALAATPGLQALKPLAPVHFAARRESAGVRLSWIRRTRRDGDSWAPVEVPLAEERERYAIAILAPGGAILREFASEAPELLYPAAAEAADLGGPQASLRVCVAQVSAVAGPGRPAIRTVAIR